MVSSHHAGLRHQTVAAVIMRPISLWWAHHAPLTVTWCSTCSVSLNPSTAPLSQAGTIFSQVSKAEKAEAQKSQVTVTWKQNVSQACLPPGPGL